MTNLQNRLAAGDKLAIDLPKNCSVNLDDLEAVFLRLAADFPGDIGCFSVFFLNYFKMLPGDAVFLEVSLST